MSGVASQCAVKYPSIVRRRSPGVAPPASSRLSSSRFHGGREAVGARLQIVLNYGVLAPLCDPILGRVPIYRATYQVAALHEAIEGYADIQFANIAPTRTGTS